MSEDKKGIFPHNCILEDRKRLSVSGVNNVGSFDEETIVEGIKTAHGVKGRAQVVDLGLDATFIIDYAHTPDGVENILKTVRGFAKGRVEITEYQMPRKST